MHLKNICFQKPIATFDFQDNFSLNKEIEAISANDLARKFKRHGNLSDVAGASQSFADFIASQASQDVVLRGAYDVSALRAGSDLMLWLHAPTAEALQAALRDFGRTQLGAAFGQVFSAVDLKRERNRRGNPWVTVKIIAVDLRREPQALKQLRQAVADQRLLVAEQRALGVQQGEVAVEFGQPGEPVLAGVGDPREIEIVTES